MKTTKRRDPRPSTSFGMNSFCPNKKASARKTMATSADPTTFVANAPHIEIEMFLYVTKSKDEKEAAQTTLQSQPYKTPKLVMLRWSVMNIIPRVVGNFHISVATSKRFNSATGSEASTENLL